MLILEFVSKFRKDEDGAVTVDWVMLSSGTVVFGILAYTLVKQGVTDAASDISSVIASAATAIT